LAEVRPLAYVLAPHILFQHRHHADRKIACDAAVSAYTRIEVEDGGELFVREILAPGRVAHGEIFQYEEIDWECDLIYDGRLTVRERYFLRPDNTSIAPLQTPFPAAFFTSCYLITDRCPADHDCWKKVRALNSEKVRLGVTPLIRAGWSIKILTEDSLTMATTCNQLRQELSDSLPELTEAERFQ
jgi:urease accessory protein